MPGTDPDLLSDEDWAFNITAIKELRKLENANPQ